MSKKWSALPLSSVIGVLCSTVVWSSGELALAQDDGAVRHREPIILNRAPVRILRDPYPTFHGIAIREEKNEIFLSDDNQALGNSVLVYDRYFGPSDEIMEPIRRIAGPATRVGEVCMLAISPEHNELYSPTMTVMLRIFWACTPWTPKNTSPIRELNVPHGTWGVFLESHSDELFITVEHVNKMAALGPRRTRAGSTSPLEAPSKTKIESSASLATKSCSWSWS